MVVLKAEARENLACGVTMLVVVFVFIVLRFYVRYSLRQNPYLSDWLCIISFVVFTGYCAAIFNHIFKVSKSGRFEGPSAASGGTNSDTEEAQGFMKMGLAIELLFTLSISLTKSSILAFYWNIFSVNQIQKNAIIFTTSLVAAWWITFTLLILVQCKPLSALWEEMGSTEYCISSPHLLLPLEITNLLIDVVIMALPVLAIRNLSLDNRRKWSVLAIFLLGAAVIVTSIVRITAIWNPPHVIADFQFSKTVLCSTIQLGIALVCCCLPTLGPLISNTASGARRKYGNLTRRVTTSRYTMSKRFSSVSDHPWLDIGTLRGKNYATSWATHPDDSEETIGLTPLPPTKILIQKEIRIT